MPNACKRGTDGNLLWSSRIYVYYVELVPGNNRVELIQDCQESQHHLGGIESDLLGATEWHR
jgi:hypothetical protein